MKVLLFNPQSSANRKPILPMSLLAVGAVLEGKYPWQIVDGNLEHDVLVDLDRRVRDAGERVVLGVTVMPGPQLQQAVPVCRELKLRHPELVVVWAGYFPTQHWQPCVRAEYVDFVIRGHGELAFVQLLEAIAAGSGELDDLPGLAFADDNGEPRSNPPAQVPDPDLLPAWSFDAVPMERYLRSTFLGRRTVGCASSYGCPFFCNFCAVVNMVKGRWRAQSAARVAATVRLYQQRWGVDAVELVDNNFFVDEARVVEFSERIADLDVAWWGEGRIDTVLRFSEESWRAIRDGGLKMIFLGAESGSAETLETMHKGGRLAPEMTLELVQMLGRLGIVPELSFVLGNPPDPEADAAHTLEFIRKLKQLNPATEIILYMYTPVPLAGDLYHQAEASGFEFPATLEQWVSHEWLDFVQRRSRLMPWVGDSLQRRIRHFERVINAYYPTTTMAGLGSGQRALLRTASAWRYHSRFYAWPLELHLLHRLLRYQRPETTGF